MYLSLVSADNGIESTAIVPDALWGTQAQALKDLAKGAGFEVVWSTFKEGLYPDHNVRSIVEAAAWVQEIAASPNV